MPRLRCRHPSCKLAPETVRLRNRYPMQQGPALIDVVPASLLSLHWTIWLDRLSKKGGLTMRTGCKALLVVGLAIVDTPPATAASYSYTQIAAPGSKENNAAGINDSGVVAGYFLTPAGNTVVSHGFVFKNGILTTIDPPGSGGTVISGIANDGSVIGYYELGTTARVDAFILKNGTYTTFA